MNVSFHAFGSFAAAAVLSSRLLPCRNCHFLRSDLPFLVIGFVTGILLHGVLDYASHSYPFPSAFDIAFCMVFFAVFAVFVKSRNLILLVACYIGCLFPDLLDLGPAMMNKRIDLGLPVFKFFPWHWKIYSGSIYDGSRQFESNLWHFLLFSISVMLIIVFRRSLFWFGKDWQTQERG